MSKSKRAVWTKRVLVAALVSMVATVALPPWNLAPVSAAPIQVASPQQAEQGVVRPSGAELYDLPDGDVIASLPAVSFVTLYGRSADGQWLVVATDQGETGWVQLAQVIAYNVQNLPVMDAANAEAPAAETQATLPAATATALPPTATPTAPPTATSTSTPTATATPTVTPSPTPQPTNTPTVAPTTAPTDAPTAVATTVATATRSLNLPAVRTPAPRANIVGVVNVQGAILASEPGLDDGERLPAGATVALIARNDAADWVLVQRNDGAQAWLPTSAIVAFGVNDLPVAGADALVATPEAAAETGAAESPAAADIVESTEPAATETSATEADTPEAVDPTDAASADSREPVEATGVSATILMTGGRLNIRSGPGADYTIIGKALPRENVVVLGRTAALDWLRIAQQDAEGATGWVSAEFVEVSGDMAQLPIEDAAAPTNSGSLTLDAPTATATQAAASESTVSPGTAQPTADTTPAPLPTETPVVAAPSGSVVKTSATGLSGNIVFQDGKDGIWLYNLDTAELRLLTKGFDPAFSPDGRTVAFVRGDGGNNGIYTIGIDGSNERKVWGEGEIIRHPKFSPDGTRIVYSRLLGEWKCFNTEFLGCITLKQLIAWFPAAAIPAVSRAILGGAERLSFPNWGISGVGVDGEDFRDINALDSAIAPDWHNNGIVYQSKAGLEITTDTPDGETRSVFHGGWDHDPDWQPNGDFILYQSKEGSHWEIWRVTPDGGGIVALTRPETTLVDQLPSNVAPAWSPDGNRIVYLSNRDENEDAGAWRLWTMNADGSDKRQLPLDVPIDYVFAAEQVADWGPAVQ